MNIEEEKLKSVQDALAAANGCLLEKGNGPAALSPNGINDLADPLVDDLELRGWVFNPAQQPPYEADI